MCSQVKPMRSSAPGAKFSTSTSQCLTSLSSIALPFLLLVSSVTERLLWFNIVKYKLSTSGISRSCSRVMSPAPVRSILITSAPNQASSCVQVGPDCTCVKSRMRTPSSALPAAPHGFADGFGIACTPFALPPFFAAAFFALGFFLLFLAMFVSPFQADLFLAKHALRVGVADAAALAAGRRIDHRVDEGRLAGVHGRVDGALQLVGRCHLHADAAECFHHLVVARAFGEYGRRRIRTRGVDVGSAINAVVVEDDDADRQL